MDGLLVKSMTEEPEFVIPAEAGIQDKEPIKCLWMPAFAGMTEW